MARKPKASVARKLAPETLMMSLDYRPELSEGAVKQPIFKTSTWVFRTAEEGEAFFAKILGRSSESTCEGYSRFNHPNMEIFEKRLAYCEGAEAGAAFSSGMAAIFTTLYTFLRPGDIVIHSEPLYGGTDTLIKKTMREHNGIWPVGFTAEDTFAQVVARVTSVIGGRPRRVPVVYVETPANPTNTLFSLVLAKRVADHFNARLIVDNTFLGPLFQEPLQHGADLVVTSATKYIGGHSDLIAGACLGSAKDITAIKKMRSIKGDMMEPDTAWLLCRSMETLSIRMERQGKSATSISRHLAMHRKVARVYYPGLPALCDPYWSKEQARIYGEQCLGGGAMISFDIKGDKAAAFRFLNALAKNGIIKLAVSLGGTESLVTHPASTTHLGVDEETRKLHGVSDSLIRLSVGLENADDLIHLLDEALQQV